MSAVARPSEIGRDQRFAFIAAWLGWAFDGLDGFLYTLVAGPFVAELMRSTPADPLVKDRAALIQAIFLVGWALGGAVFGWVGDRIGRSKTLGITIMTYAVFTGLHACAQEWWHLLIFRFIASLGIGGEWAAGSALVSESFPKKARFWAGPILQSGYMVGQILAGVTTLQMSNLPPRWVFIVGVVPAFFTMWLRFNVKESEEWHAKAKQATTKIGDLFRGRVLKTTLLSLIFISICLTGVYVLFYYNTATLRGIAAEIKMPPKDTQRLVSMALIVGACWNIVGNFFAVWVFNRLGIRRGFVGLLAASCGAFATYAVIAHGAHTEGSIQHILYAYYACIFFCGGFFAIFPVYVPPLFPTLLRTTGAGLSYNFGRIISAFGTYFGAAIALKAGTPATVIEYAGFLYLPAMIVALLLPEMNRDGQTSEETHFEGLDSTV